MNQGFYIIVTLAAAGAVILSTPVLSPVSQGPIGADTISPLLQLAEDAPEAVREWAFNAPAPEPRFAGNGARTAGPVGGLPGVSYLSIEQQDLPDDAKAQLRAAAKALKETGSLGGDKRTHAFARVDHSVQQLRDQGLASLLGTVAITPADLGAALGPAFTRVGADVQGKQVDGRGRVGFYQVFKAGSDPWAELSEEQLDVLAGDGTVIGTELLNARVGSHPATVEQLTDEGALLVNIDWVVNDRLLSLGTRNMPREQALALALRVSQSVEALPYRGWRTAYEYDEANPQHRVTRARLAEKAQKAAAQGPR